MKNKTQENYQSLSKKFQIPIDNMNQFGSAVRNLFVNSNSSSPSNNNILETAHHSQPIFEKIDPAKYFRINVNVSTKVTIYFVLWWWANLQRHDSYFSLLFFHWKKFEISYQCVGLKFCVWERKRSFSSRKKKKKTNKNSFTCLRMVARAYSFQLWPTFYIRFCLFVHCFSLNRKFIPVIRTGHIHLNCIAWLIS